MDGRSLSDLYLKFANVAWVIPKDDMPTLAKLCEVGKEYLRVRVRDVVRRAETRAILFSYASDGTPLLTKESIVAKTSDHRTVVRKAGKGTEFLLQRATLKTTSGMGDPIVVSLLRDPVPLTHGKSALHECTAACQFHPLVRQLAPKGVILTHYCFDRALFSALDRLMRQRHNLYYDVLAGGGDNVGEHAIAELTDWICSTGCANHDVHNALKWAVQSQVAAGDVNDKLWQVVESLRNSYHLLHCNLPTFISVHLRAVSDSPDPSRLYSLWVSLDVVSSVADRLADLGLLWRDGALCFNAKKAECPDLVAEISALYLHVMRFRKFTNSRWLTIGDSCKTIVSALLLGLQPLVAMIRALPTTSSFYIGGFEQLTESVKLYAIISSIVGHVCDNFMVKLLGDDRVCRRVGVSKMC